MSDDGTAQRDEGTAPRDDGAGLSDWADDGSSAEVLARYDDWGDAYEGDVLGWGYSLPEVRFAVLKRPA